MSRPLKFRVWNVKDNEWDNPAILEVMGDDCELRALYNPPENYVIHQFTGAHDKTGEEIWEGDIVTYKGRQGTVEFFACSFVVNWGDQTDDDLAHLTTFALQVVGNIFEYKK
jgi:hypothetical protein